MKKTTHTHAQNQMRQKRERLNYQYMLDKRGEKDDAAGKSNPPEADEFRGLTFMSLTFLSEATTSMEFAFFTTSSEAGAGASTSLPAISLSLALSSRTPSSTSRAKLFSCTRPTRPGSSPPVTWGNFLCIMRYDILEMLGRKCQQK